MSKAILVMDMPDSCRKCDFVNMEMCCCGLFLHLTASIESVEKYGICRPDWCPLRELPQKRRTIGKESENDQLCFNGGYNACIDEILKGAEENEIN